MTAPWDDPLGKGDLPTLEGVAVRLGWTGRSGAYARGPCPCGSGTGGWLTVTSDGRLAAGCWSCGDAGQILGALGLDGAVVRSSRFRPPPPSSRPPAPDLAADADQLDAVYRVFAEHLRMPEATRRRHLCDVRGIPADRASRMSLLLRPLPTEPNARTWVSRRLVEGLRKVAPDDFLGRLPELSRRRGDGHVVMVAREAARYWEPWADEHGRVVALRAYMGSGADGPKYLTSPGRTGPLVHFAFGVERSRIDGVPWIFTEGWMKAEVSAHALGAVGVGFAGVNAKKSWLRALEVKQRLAPDAPAYVAFDSEAWLTRLDIAVAALDLALAAKETTGRAAGFAVWDAKVGSDGKPSPKGIDDAIVAGAGIQLVDRHEFAAYVAPLLEETERDRESFRAAA